MLTVVREMAHSVASELAHMRRPRLAAGRRAARSRTRRIAEVLERAVVAGEESVRARARAAAGPARGTASSTPAATASIIVFAGVRRRPARRRGARSVEHHARRPASRHPEHESSTLPLLHELRRHRRDELDDPPRLHRARSRRSATRCSSSATTSTLQVHVHTDDPRRRSRVFDGLGEVVAPGRRRHARAGRRARRAASPAHGRRAAASAAARSPSSRAPGMAATVRVARRARRSTAAPTLNPSTYELLAGIHDGRRRGGRRAAEQRQRDHGRRARRRAVREGRSRVVDSRWQQAGLVAAVALDPDAGAEENAARDARRRSPTCAPAPVAPAARDDAQGRFARRRRRRLRRRARSSPGASPQQTLGAVLDRARREAELVTCIARRRRARSTTTRSPRSRPAGVELELHDGGQPPTGGCWPPSDRTPLPSRAETHGAPAAALRNAAPPTREALLAAPVARRRAPRPLGAPLAALEGVGAAARAAAALGHRDGRRPARAPAVRPRDERAHRRRARDRGGGDVAVEVRSMRVRPARRRGCTDPRGRVADDTGPAEGASGSTRPTSPSSSRPGTRLVLRGTLEGGAAAAFRVAEHEPTSARASAGRHTTVVPLSGDRGAVGAAQSASWSLGPARLRAHARRAAARRGCGRARRLPARAAALLAPRTGPRREEVPGARAGSRSRSCSCSSSRSLRRRAPPRGGREARELPFEPPGDLVRHAALARLAAVRAHGRPARARSRRSTATSRAAARCSAC